MALHTILLTNDGSHTLLNSELNETYHSKHGAMAESVHVYIKNGCAFYPRVQPLKILEIGFGTGLNAWLTAIEAFNNHQPIEYTTLEKYPLQAATINALNYTQRNREYTHWFNTLHAVEWYQTVNIHTYFLIHKIQTDVALYKAETFYHLIYFDAFAPEKQPEMWRFEILKKMFDSLLPCGRLVTYCAQGAFKRTLKSIGFEVHNPPGPPGKREITVAIKP